MKIIFIFVFSSMLLLRIEAAYASLWTSPEARIVGGHEASPHSHPYIVSLQSRLLWARVHICGGALLNERWILTAGHCISESWLVRWLYMDAVAGAHNADRIGPRAQVAVVDLRIPHPLYNGGIGPHDIGMLKTKTPFKLTKTIQPIQLPDRNFDYSTIDKLTLSGWGVLKTTAFIPDLPSRLQEVEVSYIPYKECYQALEDIKENQNNPLSEEANMCSGPLTGGIAACSGDSGGPLVQFINEPEHTETTATEQPNTLEYLNELDNNILYTDEEENNRSCQVKSKKDDISTPVILGVVSWGVSPCGEEGAPSVYTKVSPYVDFIEYTMKHE